MELDIATIRGALKRIVVVERQHAFGEKTGSQTARRREIERVLDSLLQELTSKSAADGINGSGGA